MADEDKEPRIVVREGNTLMVLEEGEYCCACRATDDLMQIGMGDPADPLKFTYCNPCNDSGAFREWLAGQFEEALASDPDRWRKNPDGTWSEIKENA